MSDIPVTRAELETAAASIVERDGMPSEITWLAELVIGFFSEVDKRHRPITRRVGWKPSCIYDNHRWPCAEAPAPGSTTDGES